MNLDELKPGPDTDKLVAEAVGLKEVIMDDTVELHCYVSPREKDELDGTPHNTCEGGYLSCDVFAPSTDLNDAFWAAEQVNLFNNFILTKEGVFRPARPAKYVVCDIKWAYADLRGEETGDFRCLSQEITPAMAVCIAILKLKEQP